MYEDMATVGAEGANNDKRAPILVISMRSKMRGCPAF